MALTFSTMLIAGAIFNLANLLLVAGIDRPGSPEHFQVLSGIAHLGVGVVPATPCSQGGKPGSCGGRRWRRGRGHPGRKAYGSLRQRGVRFLKRNEAVT